jgi:hypothetical protein
VSDAEVRVLTASLILFTELALWWGFSSVIGPRYAYEGYAVRDIAGGSVALAITLSLAPIIVLPVRMERPSTGVLWVLYVLGVVPTCLFPFLVEGLPQSALYGFELLTLASFTGIVLLVSYGRTVWGTLGPRHQRRLVFGLSALAVAGLTALVLQFGLPTSFVSLSDVYVKRLAFRQETALANPLFGYLIPWMQNVVAPVLFVAALVRRHLLYAVLAVAVEMWVYLALANRQALLGLPLVVLVYLVFVRFRGSFPYVIGFGFLAIVVVSQAVDRMGVSPYVVALGVYRTMAVPGIVAAEYFEFFRGAPKVLGRDGLFGLLGKSPYPLPIPRLIGERYWGSVETNANANVWADGFANFGLLGFAVVTAVLTPVLWVLDSRVRRTEAGAVAAAAAMCSLGLANTGVLTSLLTGGFLPFAGLMWATRGAAVAGPDDPRLAQRPRWASSAA